MRLIMLMVFSVLAGCSTTVTGPITGRQYNLEIGCTDNMQAYQRERQEVVGKQSDGTSGDEKIDCPVSPKPEP